MLTERKILLALFAIAFGVRVLYAALVLTDPSINPAPITPDVLYAHKITSGIEWIREPYSPRAPGYPLFLASIFLLTGKHIWSGILAQAIMGGLLVILLFRLGKLIGGPTVGFLSALWLSFYVHHVHFSGLLIRDALATLLLAALVLTLGLPLRKMRFSLLGGAIYATLVHVDPQYLLLLPLFIAFILFFLTRHTILNVQYGVLFLSCLIVISLPWTARNFIVYKQFVPVGLEALRYTRPAGGKVPDKTETATGEKVQAVSHSRFERIKNNTVEFWRIARFVRKNTAEADESSAPPRWSIRHNAVSILSYGVLLPFFFVGIFVSLRGRNRGGILVAAVVLAYFLLRAYFGGSERARLPVEPFIILLAFYALLCIWNSFRNGGNKRTAPLSPAQDSFASSA